MSDIRIKTQNSCMIKLILLHSISSILKHYTATVSFCSVEATLSFPLRRSLALPATCQILGPTVQNFGHPFAAYQAILCTGDPSVPGSCWALLQQITAIFLQQFVHPWHMTKHGTC